MNNRLPEQQRSQEQLRSQEQRLASIRNSRSECTIVTTNGVKIKGKIEQYDQYAIWIRTSYNKQSMIYKHAVSTIIE